MAARIADEFPATIPVIGSRVREKNARRRRSLPPPVRRMVIVSSGKCLTAN